jgi:UDP-N-acetylglucosamine:LPS N-acetylglucosamine transferase
MDYSALGLKQVVLIPTPAQTEQEYLAKKFKEANCCFTSDQKDFSLKESLEKVKSFDGFSTIEPNQNEEIPSIFKIPK